MNKRDKNEINKEIPHILINVYYITVLNSASRNEDLLEEWRYSSTDSLISALDGGKW
jgi:hypothetical protein